MTKRFLWILAGMLAVVPAGHAVIFYSTGDPAYNTDAPAGDLEGSGWQFQGTFLQYLGTPVAPHHFITAKHFGGSVGNTFTFDGVIYTTIAKTVDDGSDLVLWEVDGTFPRYAPLYEGSDEVGKSLVVFGRGVDRGAAVTNTVTSGQGNDKTTSVVTNGWKWGTYNYTQRWGENSVSASLIVNSYPVLRMDWNPDSGDNECMLADKDSGGAVFIQEDGIWKLAGINYAIGPGWTYSFSSDGSNPFNASILDFSGNNELYVWNGLSWNLLDASTRSSFYASRISSRYSWITNNIPDFDRDVDGLPDWWEIQHGGDAVSLLPESDDDGDGFSNQREWMADTVPTDPDSYFRIGPYTNVAELVFTSSTNRKYAIDYRAELTDANEIWLSEVDWFAGSVSQSVSSVSVPASNRFYRVRVKLR